MKSITLYQCDYCNFSSTNGEDVLTHEASHFGMDIPTYEGFRSLVSYCTYLRNKMNEDPEKYRDAFERSVGEYKDMVNEYSIYSYKDDMFDIKTTVKSETKAVTSVESGSEINKFLDYLIEVVDRWGKISDCVDCCDVVRLVGNCRSSDVDTNKVIDEIIETVFQWSNSSTVVDCGTVIKMFKARKR